MIGRKMTGGEILQMIEATRKQIDPSALQKDIQVRIAADHMVDRLLSMMNGANELHAHLHHNAPAPIVRASVRFDPSKGDRSFYYFFKELESGMPWELPVWHFIAPIAVGFVLLDLLDELFPSRAVTDAKYTMEHLVVLISRPVYRPGLSPEEDKRKRDHFFGELKDCEKELTENFAALSKNFLAYEEPRKDPDRGKFEKIYVNTESIADEICTKSKPASSVTQEKALDVWNRYKSSVEVKAKCCKKNKRVTYADVYDHCKLLLKDLGINSAKAFEKAVLAALRRGKRLAKRQ